jgi:hypothetical protein
MVMPDLPQDLVAFLRAGSPAALRDRRLNTLFKALLLVIACGFVCYLRWIVQASEGQRALHAEREITAADKKAFLGLLRMLETKGEFFTDESVKMALPHVRVLLALTAKDIGGKDIYPLLALSSQLAEYKEARACAAKQFTKMAHPALKQVWAVRLFAIEEPSDAVVKYLKKAVDSKEQSKELSLLLGPGFKDFKKRVEEAKVKGE